LRNAEHLIKNERVLSSGHKPSIVYKNETKTVGEVPTGVLLLRETTWPDMRRTISSSRERGQRTQSTLS